MTTPAPKVIGLIAGNGSFPLLFARAAKAQGASVVAVAMHGETTPHLGDEVDRITWVRVGQLGAMVRAFVKFGVRQAAMAGGVQKTRLFSRARPDWLGLKVLARLVLRRDDHMLRAVAAAFEGHGIQIVPSTLYMPDALTPPGVLTSRSPTERQWQDLTFGMAIAKHIGTLDIGQTVVVRDGVVVALEALEGTDACMLRAGELTGKRGAVVVKAAKPQQDLRFDVPAVGPQSIEVAKQAGVAVLGLEAGRTLMLDPTETLARAEASNIVVVGLRSDLLEDALEPPLRGARCVSGPSEAERQEDEVVR